MNQVNNKRRRESQERIEKVFVQLIQNKEIYQVSVTEICKFAKINRTTFYANYIDVYDLADKIREKMLNDFFILYQEERESMKHSYNFLKLFYHIKENPIFYKTYFKLSNDTDIPWDESYLNSEMIKFFGSAEQKEYHILFFKAGFNAIIRKWLDGGCKETPEEINNILKSEFKNRVVK